VNKDNPITKNTRKKRFNLLLTNEEYQFLKKISKIENKSISEILRNAVDYLYNPQQKENILKALDLIYTKKYLDYHNFQEFNEYYLRQK
jgi:hypothetical protein